VAPARIGEEPVEFRLLGPVEVVQGTALVPLTVGRNEIVLAMLLLEAGRVVPVQRLIDALWAEEPPTTARSQVQICVSMLRKLLPRPDAVILTRPPGYLLRIPEGALDLSRFRQLCAAAEAAATHDVEESVARYREALALWRGDACASIVSQIVQQAAIRLNEERWAALENRLDLELRLGRHQQVVAELTEIVAAEPLRERLRALLMLALYRCGRQAEALEVYRTGRQILVEEIGADPGKELRTLEHAILTGDSVLDAPAESQADSAEPASAAIPLPRQLPAVVPDFVGRADLLQLGCKVMQQPDVIPGEAGAVPVMLLTGRGGIGKTTLALGIAHAVRDSFPDGQLFAKLHESGGPVTNPAGILEQFLRALGVSASAIPEEPAERTAMFRSCLADRRVLIVLDDAASARQLEPLLPGEPSCGVIVTSRSRLSGPPGALHLEVGVLDRQAAAELLDRIVGPDRISAEPEAAEQLIRLCEGLPLALRIVASKLVARGHWRVSKMVERLTDEHRRLNELDLEGSSIRATLQFSYRNLPKESRSLLDRLGVLDQADFPCWVGAPLLDTAVPTAEDTLEELVAAGLAEARLNDDGEARYRMHDMVRLFAREKLAETHPQADRLAALRRYLGCWLSLVRAAHCSFHGGDFHVVHGSAPHWPLPDTTVAGLLASPLDWFHTERGGLVGAIMLAARARLDEYCWDLAVTAVTFFELGAYPDDWYQTHEAALAVTMDTGNERGTAALLHSLGLRATGRDIEAARDFLRQSLEIWERLADPHGEALALVALANVSRLTGAFDAASDGYQRALDRFAEAADLAGQASALRGIGQVAMERGDHEQAGTLLDRSATMAKQAGAKRDAAQSMYYSSELRWRVGDFAGAEERLRHVARQTSQNGDIIGEGYALLGLAITGLHTQALTTQVASQLSRAEALARRSGDTLLRGRIMLAGAELEFVSGSPHRARAKLTAAREAFAAAGSPPLWQFQCDELDSKLS
jgi:DNA-binding SARP family transcriptional activator